MPKVTLSTELPASAGSVWNLIGGFNALPDWHPAISKSELSDDGFKRTLHIVGGGSIIKQLETTGEGHRYSYPFSEIYYRCPITVVGGLSGPGYIPDNESIRIIQGIYQLGLDNLSRLFGV